MYFMLTTDEVNNRDTFKKNTYHPYLLLCYQVALL